MKDSLHLRHTKVKVKPAYEPRGPSGRSLSRFLQHEATGSISTPRLDGMLVHHRSLSSIKLFLEMEENRPKWLLNSENLEI